MILNQPLLFLLTPNVPQLVCLPESIRRLSKSLVKLTLQNNNLLLPEYVLNMGTFDQRCWVPYIHEI